MKRRFRLTRSIDFKRVRRDGKSYAHPLVVLYKLGSEHSSVRVGVTAGLAVGNAVQRNRSKRLLREAIRPFIPNILPGSDVMLIARSPLAGSNLQQTSDALSGLLKRARLLTTPNDD